jgi:ATP-dependent 26S proteasome regulatory subunit
MNFNRDIIKFDPDTDDNTFRYEAGEADFYINDVNTIGSTVNAGGNDSSIMLEKGTYKDGPIAATSLELTQKILRSGSSSYSWTYDGTVKLRPEADLDTSIYYDQLEEMLDDVDDYTLENFYFNNSRLLVAKNSGVLAVVSCYDNQLKYTNNHRGVGSTRKLISMNLDAPTLSELDNRPYAQLTDHVRGYMLAVNAVSAALDVRPRLPRLLVTPKGPFYPTAKRNQYSAKPVELAQNEVAEDIRGGKSKVVHEEAKPGIRLDDIGGLEPIRRELKQVALSFKHPEIMEQWGAERPQGVFLYGPPGTGKTTLARALAHEIEGDLWEIKSSAIYSKWLGESEKNIEALFAEAHKKTEPTVMLFDEFESLIQGEDSDSGSGRTSNAVVGIFKREVTKLRESNPNIIMVAASNYPDKIDESLIRAGRFDVKCYVPLPEADARTQILSNNIADRINELKTETFNPFADDLDVPALAGVTDGMSGADLVEVLRRASFNKAMRQAMSKDVAPITQQDLLDIITEIRQS